MSAIEVIGVVSGILGIIGFVQDQFADVSDANSAKVKIWAGLDADNGLSNAGGSAPDVRLWNNNGDFIGMTNAGDNIPTGESKEITISMDNAQQPTYSLFSANDDAICIAYMTMTFPDAQQWGWTADWPAQDACSDNEVHATWYWSNIELQNRKDDKLPCIWIDGNGDQPATGFQVYWPAFRSDSGDNWTVDDYCNPDGYLFRPFYDNDPSSVFTGNTVNKRDDRPHARSFSSEIDTESSNRTVTNDKRGIETVYSNDSRLIVTSAYSHDIEKLCKAPRSSGPDMANTLTGLFCDMSTKTLYPICSDSVTDTCFDVGQEALRSNSSLATRQSSKDYSRVVSWS